MKPWRLAFIYRFLLVLLCCLSMYSHATQADFEQIQERGSLRVITWLGVESYLPRAGSPPEIELDYLQQFAEEKGLDIELVGIERFNELIPALLSGKGDVIAANLTITPQRNEKVAFAEPFAKTTEYLVIGSDAEPLASGDALADREIAVQKGTSYAITAQGLERAYPGLKIREVPGNISRDEMMDKVASGEYDLAIIDENYLASLLTYRDDIRKSLQASAERKIAWAVRPDSNELLDELNLFLRNQGLAIESRAVSREADTQWDRIQNRGSIQFVLRNNMPSYYIWRGEVMGFHKDIAKKFAASHKLRLEIIVAPDNAALLQYVANGKGDIALGFLTPSKEREAMGIAFTRPYHYSSEVLVARTGDDSIKTTEDLADRSIAIRKSSAYWNTAKELQQSVSGLQVVAVDEAINTEEIIDAVGDGTYDLTIADSHLVEMEINLDVNVKIVMELTKPQAQSWAIRAGNDGLLDKANRFIKKHYRGLFYNVTYNKYFKNLSRMEQQRTDVLEAREGGELSPYDDLIRKYAEKYGYDHRLMVAQMHQESRFDPDAESYTGAKGLFQVMPRTASELGFKNLEDPEKGIHAGIKYMKWVEERLEPYDIRDDQLVWFTLAAYNAGYGHVTDAIRLARQKGWRDDVWFGNVENAMLLLSQKKYASKARYGYVRGMEPYNYVRSIKQRYEIYQQEG